MYEVKVNIIHGNLTIPVTIATFEDINIGERLSRSRAIRFAKAIDKGFAVDVVNTEDEDNRDKAFGLVYSRDAEI